MERKIAKELLTFIAQSPSSFHAVQSITDILDKNGFHRLAECEQWDLTPGKYYVTRNRSSVAAFYIPGNKFLNYQIIACHSDSPAFKIKEHGEIVVDRAYTKLNTEVYGGMLFAPWFDRPLSIAGRVLIRENARLVTKLVNVDHDLLVIPNLAIHMNREANSGYTYNAQKDLLPLFGDENAKGRLMDIVAECAGISRTSIAGSDLFLYNRMDGTIWGSDGEFLSSPRLDDLQCAFASLKGFLQADNPDSASLFTVFDNEEVGSSTKQGAASSFLSDVLRRINRTLGGDEESYCTRLANSFMVSADNAHAVHPNHPEKSDPENRVYLNRGIVIKYNANQKYTTDGVSSAIFRTICEQAKIPYQVFTNRSDMAGGSKLGSISNTQAAMNTVDIGLAQLAMHSPYETGGVMDTCFMAVAAEAFYNARISCETDGVYVVH
ncbi:M18 family aminopeptidase [Ruminococcus sp. OA3]|uniref:M18 family aminopeptidase n=1 Tax=Ruminococcus sp. OA3 TaxID=2914164 RepID=UPI001F05F8ED|nr:M18 family aminopeptidase [Ruminococcus sp. OA3]MCH1983064.1 M18 family aminopeptidase [Ruminococcus sp. OA3]